MKNKESDKTLKILLVEDNPGDVRLVLEALKSIKKEYDINIVMDGEQALDYLRRKDKFTGVLHPDIILLDLNLPKINGLEVLSEIKSDSILKTIPVIILSSSEADSDIYQSYHHHANCYLTKPSNFQSFMDLFDIVDKFWFNTVKLARREYDG